MTTLTKQRIADEQIQAAKAVDLLALAEQCTTLRKCAPNEYEGPCPSCGGTDRFHVNVKEQWYFCRQCHPITKKEPGHDVIGFTQWLHRVSFVEAVERLTNTPVQYTAPPVQRRAKERTLDEQTPAWSAQYEGELRAAVYQLHNTAAGQPGRDYLLGRGLGPEAWRTFGLGYTPRWKVQHSDEWAPAILMPWRDPDGTLAAVQGRFLQPQIVNGKQEKTKFAPGSKKGGRVFGWQAFPEGCTEPLPADHTPVERKFTLLIVEGEINAMSAWQAGQDTRLDVLSIGSESSHLADDTITYARRYGSVLLWTDKPDIARQLADQLPNVHAVSSPAGEDANDLHKQGQLGAFLTFWRTNITQDDEQRMALYWDLWDGAHLHGIDVTTAAAVNRLGEKMGRPALAGGAA